jgi:hypothetical protein
MPKGPTTARRALVVVLAAAAVALALAGVASADAEDDLAQRFAPVVRLVDQPEECGPGEPYEPSDIDAFMDEDTVALRGPWSPTDLVEIAPSAATLGRGLLEYHLDFPGNALDPGCGYERWARHVTEGKEPTVYAHVANEPAYPGRLSLQYWFYYPFNDWNNTHEGDWEMIQLVFDAGTAEEALGQQPAQIGYSQHEGAEASNWDDEKLEVVDGTHPVVYPAAGSHANFYDPALFLGRSAKEGVGCDDTRGPSRELRPVVRTIPADGRAARAAYPWIAFEGRWGELQKAFFNGPTGPNLKAQWTKPITWAEDWRDQSYAIPAGGLLGSDATDFFCGAVGGGSNLVRHLADAPLVVLAVLAALAVLVVLLVSRTSWRPGAAVRVARRRSWGQTVTSTFRMYARHPLLFLGIGLVTIPISVLITLLQSLLVNASTIVGVPAGGEGGGFRVALVVGAGTVLTLLGLALVQAASARAMVEIDEGRPVGVVHAYRLSLDSVLPMIGALAIAVTAVSLLTLSIFLLPVALVLAVRWALLVPCAELEERRALGALRRSGSLVRRQWVKVLSLVVFAAALVIVAGPVVGALLLLVTSLPYAWINVLAGILYAVAMPAVGITTTYVYYDTRVREELADDVPRPDELPAELPATA